MKNLLMTSIVFVASWIAFSSPSKAEGELQLPGVTHSVGLLEAITWLERGSATHYSQFGKKQQGVIAAFFWMAHSLPADEDFREAYLNFRSNYPKFSSKLSDPYAVAIGTQDISKTAEEVLALLDRVADVETKEEAYQILEERSELSFQPSKLHKREYRFILRILARELLTEWVALMDAEDAPDERKERVEVHQEHLRAVSVFLKTLDPNSPSYAVGYNDAHRNVFKLTKKMMGYRR